VVVRLLFVRDVWLIVWSNRPTDRLTDLLIASSTAHQIVIVCVRTKGTGTEAIAEVKEGENGWRTEGCGITRKQGKGVPLLIAP